MAQDGTAGDTNVSGAQGVQAGSGNTQINNWSTRAPLTPAILAARNAEAGAARIRQLSHDEAVDLFADTGAEVLAAKLKVLLRSADQQRVVAILADLDASKAAELISPLATAFPWLPALPVAAEALAQRAAELEWDQEPEIGRLERAGRSPKGTEGYFRQYTQGSIYWRNDVKATFAVSGEIGEFHAANGGTEAELGFPEQDGGHWHSGRADGRGQPFEGGYLFSSSHGTYSLSPEFWGAWHRWLGFPLGIVEAHDGVTLQRFEEGSLYSSKAGMFAVRSEVAESGKGLLVPISTEELVRSDPAAWVQYFEWVGQGGETAVYSSTKTGAHPVSGAVLGFYKELGGPDSALGLPVAAAEFPKGIKIRYFQRFEHGSIYFQFHTGARMVPAETVALVGDRLGWPVSQEESAGTGDGDRIQFFENGVVTLRGGRREAWCRER